ncbi:hypothetical protein H8958_005658 [Nasalis larvatus]
MRGPGRPLLLGLLLVLGAAGRGQGEIVPRDLRMKDKFLKHLTGPLYFSPKCSKHFHRLYHNTRDCTIPAYYKRCARLLTRLAVSPVCMEDKVSLDRSALERIPKTGILLGT